MIFPLCYSVASPASKFLPPCADPFIVFLFLVPLNASFSYQTQILNISGKVVA